MTKNGLVITLSICLLALVIAGFGSVLIAQNRDRVDTVFSSISGNRDSGYNGYTCDYKVYKLTMSDKVRFIGTCFCPRGGDSTSICGITVSE